MVRYPVEGKTKTRLARALGDKKATEVYNLCVQHSLQETAKLPAQE